VLEGDVKGRFDADRIAAKHVPVTQINTDPSFGGGSALEHQVERTPDYVPNLTPAFQAQHPSPGQRPAYRQVEAALAGQIRRAGTAAFARAFRIAALIALAGLVPLAVARRLRSAG